MPLTIKVQVDRLPDIDIDGIHRCQLGLRISAVIAPSSDQPTQESDCDLMLPWRWRAQDNSGNGSWNIHDKTNWSIWIRDGAGVVTMLDPADIEIAVPQPVAFDPPSAPGAMGLFRARLAQEIGAILHDGGIATLQPPAQGGRITGRTVFGLVESLTAMPSPVPAALNVWTALTLSQHIAVDDDTQFLAAPAFMGANTGLYQPATDAPMGPAADGSWRVAYAAIDSALRPAVADIHPSLPMAQLVLPAGANERLIDLSTLLVRRGVTPFESTDWSSTLASRIAEAIAPSARTMAVLDDVIRASVSNPSNDIQAALRWDLLPNDKGEAPDRLRRLLASLHARVVAARARNARTAPAPALSFLERLAMSNPALWPTVAPLMLAHAGAEDDMTLPALPPHALIGRTQLAQLADVTMPRRDMPQHPDWPDIVDAEGAFSDWLLRHWTSMPPAALVVRGDNLATSLFAGTYTHLIRQDGMVQAQTERTGVLDLMLLDWGARIDLPLSLEPAGAALPERLSVKLTQPAGLADAPPTFTLDMTPLTLAMGGATRELGPKFIPCIVIMHIAVSTDQTKAKRFTLTLGFVDTGRQELQALDVALDITERARGGRLCLEMVQTFADGGGPLAIGIAGNNAQLERLRAAARQLVRGQAMRASIALAYAGPAVAALMSGWAPLRNKALSADDLAGADIAGHERLAAAVERYVGQAADFNVPFTDAMAEIDAAIASGTTTEVEQSALSALRALIESLRTRVKHDAVRLARQLIPAPDTRDADRLTQDALPLSFIVDQLQDFDDTVDLWARLAGLGVLIGREDAGKTTWWSLNAASLHVSEMGANNARAALDARNAVTVHAAGANWWKAAQVDPVPLVVTDIQGVRNAVIRYECQSIIAETQKRPQMDPRGQATVVARRPEAYLFPVEKGFPKLPPLTFGRHYKIVPYLIGHGGVVPPALRPNKSDPCSWFTDGQRDAYGGFMINEGDVAVAVRSKHYLRSVPVGAPRLVSRLPGLIEGVSPLAAELPVAPTPVTLRDGRPAAYFLDKEQTAGLLGCPPGLDAASAGVEIIVQGIMPAASGHMVIRVRRLSPETNSIVLEISVPFDVLLRARGLQDGTGEVGLRLQVVGKLSMLQALVGQPGACAEDQPVDVAINVNATAHEPVSEWTACAIELACHGATVDVLPPSIQWGTSTDGGPLALIGERGMYPAELVPRTRATTLLDGIGPARERVWPSSAVIELERPATPLATYDRWINGPISRTYGNADRDDIVAALGNAARVVTSAGTSEKDRTLDDPAVEALVYELVQLFPTRELVQAPTLVAPQLGTLVELLGTPGRKPGGRATLNVMVADTPGPGRPGELRLRPGHVYEVRLYGAVAQHQPLFAPPGVDSIDRFSPVVVAGWRDVTLAGRPFHLGAPLVLTFEVASGLMPELYQTEPPFYVTLRRPPEVPRDTVQFRLLPDRITTLAGTSHIDRYQALRMVDRIGVMEQRWNWRGRPHAELGGGTITAFGDRDRIDAGAAAFVDAAFLGRRHDDIGPIKEIRIQRHHVYAGHDRFARTLATALQPRLGSEPVVLESDLDYRGGANLWRFALRARSRYAAMRREGTSMLRFSHIVRSNEQVRWLRLIVSEQVNAFSPIRMPKRPGLALVIPLTETLQGDGGVPPLLAFFNEPMFPLFHAGDAVEAVIDVARHPFPAIERVAASGTAREELVAAWNTVDAARNALDEAIALLARHRQVDAAPAPGAIDAAAQQVDQARALYDKALDDYGQYLDQASAGGYEEQLHALLTCVKDLLEASRKALANTDADDTGRIAYLEHEISRYEERQVSLEKEIEEVQTLPTVWRADVGRTSNPSAKYWPEFAPDPIRSGSGATGRPVALRCDGPVGYTFDIGTEAGRFDHAGLLLSPVADSIRPWSMVKLGFRRLETPELLTDTQGMPLEQQVRLDDDPSRWLRYALASGAHAAPGADETIQAAESHRFATMHEGLAVDFALEVPNVLALNTAPAVIRHGIGISFDQPDQQGAHVVVIQASAELSDLKTARLSITASTQLGISLPWSITAEPDSHVALRLVISQEANAGSELGQEVPPPRGHVSVRARIAPPDNTDRPDQAHEHAWLSVVCLPLTSGTPKGRTQPPLVWLGAIGEAVAAEVRPIRLSEFTPAVWCQFAAAMSQVMVSAIVKTTSGKREVCQALSVSDLTAQATKDGNGIALGLRGLSSGESLTSIALSAEGAPDDDAQVEERLYAVVTQYIYDAFDLIREQPLRVHLLPETHPDGSTILGPAVWPAGSATAKPYATGSGRIRILRVLRGRSRDTHGFEKTVKEFPRDFFLDSSDIDASAAGAPADGAGQILGISQPFEWTSYVSP